MLRWLSAGICALIIACLAASPALADTGTYRITDYTVKLEPQSNGTVRMTFSQDWVVNSGNIPWITVGLPNTHFNIESENGAVKTIRAENSGGFTGVRIDLDKTYVPGQTFNIQFTVLQGNLLERLPEQNQWRIAYTPGWYDNAYIDHMQINLVSPVDINSYTSITPMPTATAGNIMSWEKTNLRPGTHTTILVQSPDGSFLTQPSTNIGGSAIPGGSSPSAAGLSMTMIIMLVMVGIFVMVIIWASIRAKQKRDEANTILIQDTEKELAADPAKKATAEKGFENYVEKQGIIPDAEGRYFDRGYGNYITPAIWTAVITRNANRPNPPSFGGGHSSCACVSCACACACACAGGGAAGCTKKGLHRCEECEEPEKPHVD
jgi:hypothetical protein